MQMGTTLQAQSLACVESSLEEHGSSIGKITTAQGEGFACVDDDMNQMGKCVNQVKVEVDTIDDSVISVLEHLEALEEESALKDKLI